MKKKLTPSQIGRLGGLVKSRAKTRACRLNAQLPRKKKPMGKKNNVNKGLATKEIPTHGQIQPRKMAPAGKRSGHAVRKGK